MTINELFEEIEQEKGTRLYNIDHKNNRLVISILLTSIGTAKADERYDITNQVPENLVDDLYEVYDQDDKIKKYLEKARVTLPELPLPNPILSIGYNDPAADLVAYWYLDEVKSNISLKDIGHNYWFTVDVENFNQNELTDTSVIPVLEEILATK